MSSPDSTEVRISGKKTAVFYDSLAVRASRHKITKWLYDWMICSAKVPNQGELLSYEYYQTFAKKTIGSISIKSLEVFGPDFSDTAKTTRIWIEKMANKMHSKSNLSVIRKNLWIKEGQSLDPDLVMDNERLLRSLPYLKDVRILITPREFNSEVVDILILTKDVFSFGISGAVGNIQNGQIELYDNNILGIGHEIGAKLIAHTSKSPHLGFEAYYAINNVKGNFINFSAGYANSFLRQSIFFSLERGFLKPSSVFAGGLTFLRNFRSNQAYLFDPVSSITPLDNLFMDIWYGRRLKLGIKTNDGRFQTTFSGRIRYNKFYDRPLPDLNNQQYFSNSIFYLGSLSFSQRSYIRDYLIYSYGITEDIPKGYLHELVFGFDKNEFGDRFYSHVFLSSGNIFKNKPYYFYSSLAYGSFWNSKGLQQGMADANVNFISPLFQLWHVQTRQFIRLNYTTGINRFEEENLLLRTHEGIRGFGSRIGNGKQRLTLNIENVFFQKKAILNFQTAFFTFFDVGIVGPARQSIFNQSYYAGLGLGLRIRNENLVFKTIQIRLAYYPNHPSDLSSFGFILDGISKTRFYSFQPRGPEPLRFE